MTAPKYIKAKAEALSRALDQVAKLSNELEAWYATKTDDYAAQDFYCGEHLDIPWEFNIASVLEELDNAADGSATYSGGF